PNDFRNSAMMPGQSWSDPYSSLNLTINGVNSGGLSVSAKYDQPCASVQFSSTVFGATGGTGTATVTASPGCSWTALASSWITLTGQTSGVGSASNRNTCTRSDTLPAGSTPYISINCGATEYMSAYRQATVL